MFFNAIWLYGAATLLVLGMATGRPALTVLATLVLLTAGASWLWARLSLIGLSYDRELSSARVFQGETLELRLNLVNRKLLPLAWLRVEDELPDRLTVLDRRVTPSEHVGRACLPYVTSLRPFERVRWSTTLQCPRRGLFTLGPTTVRSGDIFGFAQREQRFANESTLIVYPRLLALPELGLPPRQLFGMARATRALLVDPLRTIGVRDYRVEDSFRHMHWKATARFQRPQVKVFEPALVRQLGIFVNLDTFQHYWEGLDTARSEASIAVTASLAGYALGERYGVGVFANGLTAGSDQILRVQAGSGPEQLTRILEGLARLSVFATQDFPKLLHQETLRFPYGSTLIVVTPVMTPPLAAVLTGLAARRQRAVLIGTGEFEIPAIRGLLSFHIADAVLGLETARAPAMPAATPRAFQ